MMQSMQTPIMLGSDKATQKLIAPIQQTLTADRNYSVGELFIFNNGLYRVTTAISGGGL